MLTKLKHCPCCGTEVSEPIYVAKKLFHLSPKQSRLLRILKSAPEGLTNSEVMDRLYINDADGGPISSNVISVMKANINKKLIKAGMTIRIESTMGAHAIYRLVETGVNSEQLNSLQEKVATNSNSS